MSTLVEILLFGLWGALAFYLGVRWERSWWQVVAGCKHEGNDV